jgi:hypothetical protein
MLLEILDSLESILPDPRKPIADIGRFLYYPEKIFSSSFLEKCSLLCKGTYSVMENEIFPTKRAI